MVQPMTASWNSVSRVSRGRWRQALAQARQSRAARSGHSASARAARAGGRRPGPAAARGPAGAGRIAGPRARPASTQAARRDRRGSVSAPWRVGPVQPQLAAGACRLVSRLTSSPVRATFFHTTWRMRVAAPPGAHAVEFAAVAALACALVAARRGGRRQRRRRLFGPRPGQHARRRAPHGPGAEQAEREHASPPPASARACQPRAAGTRLRCALAWPPRRHVAPGHGAACGRRGPRSPGRRRGARAPGLVITTSSSAGSPANTGGHRPQVQGQAAQVAVRQVHRHQPGAGEQEGQRVAQVELVVDGRQQHHHQRGREGEAGPGGQDVDVALGQRPGVGERQPDSHHCAQALARRPAACRSRQARAATLRPARRQGMGVGLDHRAHLLDAARGRRRAPAPGGARWPAAGSPACRRAPRSRGRPSARAPGPRAARRCRRAATGPRRTTAPERVAAISACR